MKKKTKFLLFSIAISFVSCNSAEDSINLISSIDADFPTSEKLEFKPFNRYDIMKDAYYMIDDSVLWYFTPNGKNDIGSCYDLNTGKQLSTIAMKGQANNEFIFFDFPTSKMTRDSVQIHTGLRTIKTFAKKDIVDNKPMNERKFSVVTAPDSIYTNRIVRLPNGSVLTVNFKTVDNPQTEKDYLNNNPIVIFNENEAKGYQTINYGSFDLKMSGEELKEYSPETLINNSYANGFVEIKGNDLIAISMACQFIFYTFDPNNGKVVKEKRYTNMRSAGVLYETVNDMEMSMRSMSSSDKYLFCLVRGYFNEKDKELKLKKRALFVFDWDLNPIKKFDLPDIESGTYVISNDCSSIYTAIFSDNDGLTLTKADLKI